MAKTQINNVLLLNLLLLILIASSSSSSNEFDTYQLVIQWDPATCSDRHSQPCSKVPLDKFSIGGLWPARISPFQIVGPCSGSTFNPQNIRPVNFGLKQYWPDVISENNTKVWRDQWTVHGTCSEGYLNQLDYFSFGLNSFNSRNWLQILLNYDIRPAYNVYSKSRIEQVISRVIGARPALHCNTNNLVTVQQLHQIRMCYSKNSKALRDCPSTSGTCPDNIQWYPYMRRVYSYFHVSFVWEPAACSTLDSFGSHCVNSPRIRFSISGVTPMRSTTWVVNCPGSNFNVDQLSPILDRLDRIWPDLFRRRNDQLWENQWRVVGACSEDQFGQLQYFSFAVQAYEAYDLLTILRSNNIRPNGQIYTRAAIENAIIRSGASMPFVACNRSPMNTHQMYQIFLCYDEYGRRVVDCPPVQIPFTRCPASFTWLP